VQTKSLLQEFPPALPPPKEDFTIPKLRFSKLQFFLRLICITVALSVMFMCAFQKLNSIFEEGIATHIQNLLFSPTNQKSLGGRISAVAFGTLPTYSISEEAVISMPEIFYLPKNDIAHEIENDKKQTETELALLYSYDLSAVPKGFHPIIPTDASTADALALKNDTSYAVDMEKAAKDAKNLVTATTYDEPLVLIVHTHGTESFSSETPYYSDTFNHPRSEDVSQNVVAVGKVLCDELNKRQIPTVHCETMHDKESYIAAYDRSAESIKHYLEKYPSIKYVFDVHRDSMIRSDLTKLRPVTLQNGKPCAQIMMIIGSDEKGAGDYPWEQNLALAVGIQQELSSKNAGIARKLYLRGASYNQQYAAHGLLLEIGSCGNTLAEAKEAARAFAYAFEKTIKKD